MNRLIKCCVFLLPALAYVQGCAALTEPAGSQQLLADYQALQKQKAELAAMLETGNLSARDQSDFEIWIKQQQRQMADSYRSLAASDGKLPVNPPCKDIIAEVPVAATINTRAEKTEAEKTTAKLDQFNGSLGEFDEKLLREQDRVKAKTPRTDMSQSGGGSSGADAGSDSQSNTAAGDKNSSTSSGRAGDNEKDQQNEHDKTANQKPGSMGRSSTTPSSNIPKDIPDGKNDDVIARQLREAAEKEADPELRKKLWDEYRRYKAGSR